MRISILLITLLSVGLCFISHAQQIQRHYIHKVIIKTNGYNGNYAVKPENERGRAPFVTGDTMFEVSVNTPYSINNGATIGFPGQPFNSYIWFYIADDGTITGVEPYNSALVHDSTIEMQTTSIDIDPGLYSGQYLLSAYQFAARNHTVGYNTGRQSFTAIKSLVYTLKPTGDCRCGALNMQQTFLYFMVDALGNAISLNPQSLQSDKGTLRFITKPFTLDSAQNLCKQYKLFYVTGYNKEPIMTPLQTPDIILHIICGSPTCLHADAPEGVKCQCFFPK